MSKATNCRRSPSAGSPPRSRGGGGIMWVGRVEYDPKSNRYLYRPSSEGREGLTSDEKRKG